MADKIFIALVNFDHSGIPGYPMEILANGEGSGYSRIGHVPQAGLCLVIVNTSISTYNSMNINKDIVIIEELN